MRLITALMLSLPLSAQAEAPRVVVDIPPVHALVSMVMEGVGTPDLLLSGQSSPHDASLKPSDARKLQDAALLVGIGPALTPWLEDAAKELAPNAAHLELLDLAAVQLEVAEGGHHHGDDHDDHDDHGDHEEHDDHEDHEDEKAHDDHEDEGDHKEHAGHEDHAEHDDHHDDHGGEPIDPHAWLNIRNGVEWLSVIAAELQKLDPENAQTYAKNAKDAVADLVALDEKISAQLAPVADVPHLVYHDAYAYFRERHPLNFVGSLASNEGVAPSVADLRRAEAELDDGAICVFSEVQFSDKLVAQLSAEGGVQVMQLDPLGSAFEPGAALYAQTLTAMADTFEACLSG